MSEKTFTTEQDNAIGLRGKNLLVSASAGTGKTTVLVERIIRMATDPVNPVDLDRMLIVTFTNAASEEMKSRIRNALYDELKKSPGDQRLRRQLILLGQANISTIHSFCSDVIRSNYHLLDIDPGFGVCDEGKANGYLEEAMSNVLAESYAQGDDAFIRLVDGYGRGNDDSHLAKLLSDIYKKARSMPDYRKWLKDKAVLLEKNTDDFGETKWGSLILEHAGERITSYLEDITNLIELIEDDEFLVGYIDTLASDHSLIEKLAEKFTYGKWDECKKSIDSLVWQRLANAKKGALEHLKSIVKDTRNEYKKEIGAITGRLSGTSEQINSNMKDLSPVLSRMTEVILRIDKEYTEIKNENGMVDYNDLEHYALECLEKDAGAMYRDRFDEIFVDEYQDSNHIQERIVSLVAGHGQNLKNVFMVGDVKQSIYRFRMADPKIFAEKNETFSNELTDDDVRIDLFENYRSREPILDFTNFIFMNIMSRKVGDEDYTGNVMLKPGKKPSREHPDWIDNGYPEGNDNGYPVEIKLVCGDDKILFTSDISKESREASVVGHEILQFINSGMTITDKRTGKERKVEFRDMAILIRSANTVSADYVRQLKKMGIPVYSESSSDFFKEREIRIMEAFCRVIDNPRQDIPLVALLRSSIFGFTDMELAYIRCYSRFMNYYDSLLMFSEDDLLKDKIHRFLETIQNYRNDSVKRPMDRLIWDMMHETGFYYFCEEGDNPEIRQRNLRRLFEIAGTYEGGRETGIFGFISYLEQLEKTGIKDTSVSGGDANVVTLMSIHKSKGLEFPVVFISTCGKGFNRREYSENVIFDRELGFGPDYIDAREGLKLTTAVKKSIKIKKEIEDLAEEMRVLYVALTRAREKLVITGYVKTPVKSFEKWHLKGIRKEGKISPGKVILANGYMDWIMPVIISDDIKDDLENGKYHIMHNPKKDGPYYKIDVFDPIKIKECLDYRQTLIRKPVIQKDALDYITVKDRFEWEYPYAHEGIFHKKVSVTELKKLHDVQPGERDIFHKEFIPRPEFMNEGRLDAAGRGTMLHNIIAAVNQKRVFEPDYVRGLCKKSGCIEEQIEDSVAMILDFFKSNLGKRIIAADSESEKPFLFPVLTKELYPDSLLLPEENHTTLVQGVIDCMFYENDGIVIVDYKSDHVIEGNEQVHAKKYSLQLEMYAKAVSNLTGVNVKEKYIYFLQTRCSVRVP